MHAHSDVGERPIHNKVYSEFPLPPPYSPFLAFTPVNVCLLLISAAMHTVPSLLVQGKLSKVFGVYTYEILDRVPTPLFLLSFYRIAFDPREVRARFRATVSRYYLDQQSRSVLFCPPFFSSPTSA